MTLSLIYRQWAQRWNRFSSISDKSLSDIKEMRVVRDCTDGTCAGMFSPEFRVHLVHKLLEPSRNGCLPCEHPKRTRDQQQLSAIPFTILFDTLESCTALGNVSERCINLVVYY